MTSRISRGRRRSSPASSAAAIRVQPRPGRRLRTTRGRGSAGDRAHPHAETFIDALGIPATLDADAAYYRIDLDRIFMPAFAAFHNPIAYIGTFAHEAAHATGAKHRLDRDFTTRFGRASPAVEEMVAELATGYILADLGSPIILALTTPPMSRPGSRF